MNINMCYRTVINDVQYYIIDNLVNVFKYSRLIYNLKQYYPKYN